MLVTFRENDQRDKAMAIGIYCITLGTYMNRLDRVEKFRVGLNSENMSRNSQELPNYSSRSNSYHICLCRAARSVGGVWTTMNNNLLILFRIHPVFNSSESHNIYITKNFQPSTSELDIPLGY